MVPKDKVKAQVVAKYQRELDARLSPPRSPYRLQDQEHSPRNASQDSIDSDVGKSRRVFDHSAQTFTKRLTGAYAAIGINRTGLKERR